ncbi:MAG: hypothetical protein NC253_09540 [Ruminococcus sp.]|nr:hypothetical protein [Ruminococcus sp.]MCM1381635.1 hypothetical protein [Muribaculaceae bacterium]MCM1480055.1 hypothetical protein [Muribaculaceae bacterium]
MKKLLSIFFSAVLILTVLPVQSFAKSDKVEIYGNKISVHAKQICFVRGTEGDIGEIRAELYEPDDFKKYYFVGDAAVDFKEVAKKLPELQSLSVVCADVKNTAALAGLKDLVWLGLHDNDGAEDLSFLKKLTGLKKFKYANIYGDNPCESIKPLAYLKNLTELSIEVKGQTAADISPLKGLTKLKKLDLQNAGGEDLAILKNMKNLKDLTLDLSEKTDMTFLSSLTRLERLDVSGDTKNLSVVTGLKKLTSLSVFDSDENLSFIGEMTRLESLHLSYVSKSALQNAGKLKNLKELSLIDVNYHNPYDMSFLSELTNLEDLFIFSQRGLDITGISKLKKLKNISVHLCEFEDLSELKKCPALETLTVYNCNSNFDVKWIAGSKLKELYISGGGSGVILNMEKLATLKNMEKLIMDFTGISEETAKKIKKAVPKCKIEVCELGYGDYDVTVY